MELYIKNMVCDRCKIVVKEELQKAGLHVLQIDLGKVSIQEQTINASQLKEIATSLAEVGFEIIDDRRKKITEQIKLSIIELVHRQNSDSKVKYSEYLTQQLNVDYPYLSKLFSEETGTTIEHFTIQQKIERVKELLSYGELTLSEIAWQLAYSSVAALSGQFKKITGMTPSDFKKADSNPRQSLDKIAKNS